ncbi:capsular biosynthesis protein [Tsuneonella sp. HG222]
MTEHTKIPLPTEGEGAHKGTSLFERADALYGLTPAAVPAQLAPPVAKRGRTAKGKAQAEVVPAPAVAPSSTPIEPVASSPVVAAPEAPKPQPEPAVVPASPVVAVQPAVFRSQRHPIDRAHLAKQGLILPEGKVSGLLEEFRIVKRELLKAAHAATDKGAGAKAQRILICSPLPGEGKTFCATNLALAMAAEKDGEVVLIDADFAKPSILSTLGLPGGSGLMDALADKTLRVEDCVLATDVAGLFVLPAGNQTNSDSEYLSSNRTAEVLARLTDGAPNRMLIFDSPPALAASPAAELAKYCAQAVVVARADSTGQTSLEDALSLLSNCPDIKLLLNAAHFSPSGRRFGSYYGYEG